MNEDTALAYKHFLSMSQLRDTRQRRLLFETFMEQSKHLTAEDLYLILQKKFPKIGQATVYRTLNLLCENGFARELSLRGQSQGQGQGQGQSNYFEPLRQREHHDHMVCTRCGKHLEFHSQELEDLQIKISSEHHFQLTHHAHVLYGQCQDCQSAAREPQGAPGAPGSP